MALEDDIRILERVSLLKDFTHEQLRLLAFGAETMRLTAGRELFREGSAADCAFVVAAGSIELVREGKDASPVVLATAGPGTMLGEYALIAGGTRHVTAVARADSEVIRLSRTLFRRILEEYPDLAISLHERIASEMKSFLSRVARLAPRFGE